jgi:hypothetical protein
MTNLTAKADFRFKPARKNARWVSVRTGDRFWVTNSALNQRDTGLVMIDRHGKGTLSHGYPFSPSDIQAMFEAA